MSLGVKRSYLQMSNGGSVPVSPIASPYASPKSAAASLPHINSIYDESKQNSPEPGSRRASVSRQQSVPPRHSFSPDASIVLIGIRGSGKSSLAVLAASAYDRRLIDFEQAFLDRTGQTLASHRSEAEISEHHRRHRLIFEEVLRDHDKGCVIVCNFSDLEQGARVLRQYTRSHPVIHVVRDVKGIQAHVKVWTEDKVAQMLTISGRLLRSCSNFEFFNQTQTFTEIPQDVHKVDEDSDLRIGSVSSATPFLRLKRAERDFLKFLSLIIGDSNQAPAHHSAYPLSQIPLEKRRYTYAATVLASDVVAGMVDMQTIQTGADAIQIIHRIPVCTDPSAVSYVLGEAFSLVRRASTLPLVVEVFYDAGTMDMQMDQGYLKYLQYCLRFAPEYLMVNLALDVSLLDPILRLRGSTKIIGQISLLGRQWDGSQCRDLYNRAAALNCDMIQMTGSPMSTVDNLPLQAFGFRSIQETHSPLPLSAFNTGLAGRYTQCFNTGLTPVISDSRYLPREYAVASINAQQATMALFSSFLFEAQNFCIIGAKVDFSLSPAMHNAAYEACGMPHVFTARSSDTLDLLKTFAAKKDFGGAAVTQPYKIEVVSLVQTLSTHAKIIRAVNTVLPIRSAKSVNAPTAFEIATSRNENGPIEGLHGDNTDWIGIRACLKRGLSPINTVRSSSCGLVIGAGGMARAAIYAMIFMGVRNIFICNRTESTARELANYYNDQDILDAERANGRPDSRHKVYVISTFADNWPQGFRPPTMIVSSVPAQNVNGNLEATFTIPQQWLKSPTGGVVVELTYKPLVTALVRQIRAETHKGWVVMNGLDMLPEQGFAQFELFTGRRAPRRIMRDEVLQSYRNDHDAQGHPPQNSELATTALEAGGGKTQFPTQ